MIFIVGCRPPLQVISRSDNAMAQAQSKDSRANSQQTETFLLDMEEIWVIILIVH